MHSSYLACVVLWEGEGLPFVRGTAAGFFFVCVLSPNIFPGLTNLRSSSRHPL